MDHEPKPVSGSFLITLIVALAALFLAGFSALSAKKVTALELRIYDLEQIVAAAQGPKATADTDVVTARRVALTDAAGAVRGELYVDEGGAAVVSLRAEDGGERLRLTAGQSAAGVSVRDDRGTTRLDAGWRFDEESGGRSAVGVYDRTGALRGDLGVGEGVPAVTLYNEAGVPMTGGGEADLTGGAP